MYEGRAVFSFEIRLLLDGKRKWIEMKAEMSDGYTLTSKARTES